MTSPASEVSSVRQGPVLLVRFLKKPGLASLAAVKALTQELVDGGLTPLTLVAIVPGTLNLPSAELRARLAELRTELRPFTASLHLAIEGSGIFARLQRSMYTALAGAVADQMRFHVHATAEAALNAAGAERQLDLAPLLEQARAGGLMP